MGSRLWQRYLAQLHRSEGRVAEGLRRDLGARTFDHWLKPVRFADYCTLSGVVTLETVSRFSANWINERFGDRLETFSDEVAARLSRRLSERG